MMRWVLMAVATALSAGTASAAESLSKDLTSTIALLGLPCGQVVTAQRVAEDDYLVTCKDKNRYRVYVNAKGRVVAEKR
ncbi:MAG TPA: hypothetical protein VKD25_01285 [Burkholderiales bacterium]|nr:hypothetical protein [Burkholderiales bacterium]